MSDWLKCKYLCQRCFSGIDDDGDGNCPTCAEMDDVKAAWMKKTRLHLELAGRLNAVQTNTTNQEAYS